jgi:hypothetical protein
LTETRTARSQGTNSCEWVPGGFLHVALPHPFYLHCISQLAKNLHCIFISLYHIFNRYIMKQSTMY